MSALTFEARNVTLVETLDRVLNKGVVLSGDLTISVADVDLIFVGLRVLLASVETAGEMQWGYKRIGNKKENHRIKIMEKAIFSGPPPSRARADEQEKIGIVLPRIDARPEHVEKGLGKLVLTIVELIRKLVEKQAERRVEGHSLTDEEIERLGETLLKLEDKMEELKRVFGLTAEDLSLNLGPLGDLT